MYEAKEDKLEAYKLMLESTEEDLRKEKEAHEEDLRNCQREIRRLHDVCRLNTAYIEALEKRLKDNGIDLPEQ